VRSDNLPCKRRYGLWRRDARLCRSGRRTAKKTWINDGILDLYTALHASGHAHSLECRREGRLVGGLYGVRLGGAFFGESMFSHETDASKVALVHLVARLRLGGFKLLDAQFLTEHLARFGAIGNSARGLSCQAGRSDRRSGYWPASSGSSGMPSSAPALGDTALTERGRHGRRLARRVGLAADRPDVIERMLHPVQAGLEAYIQPENSAVRLVRALFVDLQKAEVSGVSLAGVE